MTATVAVTNYGTLLKKATTVIGEVVSLDPPTVSNAQVEATNHSSGGVAEYVPGGLKRISEFNATVNFTNSVAVSGLMTDVNAGTSAAYSIVFPEGSTWAFTAFPVSYKAEAADAQSPNALKLTVAFQPTGAITLS